MAGTRSSWFSQLIVCIVMTVSATGLQREVSCPAPSQPCGRGCTPGPAVVCQRSRCVDSTTGRNVLCTPSSHVCGKLCPLFAWCSGQQCIPNTPAHRHKAFCPEDKGVLQQVKCSSQALGTQCFGSSAGIFSCHVSGGFLVARCGKKMAFDLAAAINSSSSSSSSTQQLRTAASQDTTSSTSSTGKNALLRLKMRLTGRRRLQQQQQQQRTSTHGRTLLQLTGIIGSFMTGLKAGMSGNTAGLMTGMSGLSDYGMMQSQLGPGYNQLGGQLPGSFGGYPSSSGDFLQSYYQGVTGATYESGFDDLSSVASQYNNALAGQYPTSNPAQFSDPYLSQTGPAQNTGSHQQGVAGGYQPYAPADNFAQQQQQQQQPYGSPYYTQTGQQQQQQQYGGQYYALSGASFAATAQFNAAVADPSSASSSSNSYSYSMATGKSPGGAFIQAGPDGVIAGSYGGGCNSQYGTGASYGFSQPYYGNAAGVAVVFMPAAYAPNAPNITYPCPEGLPVGTMITVGIPCGIPLTSVPASKLPTMGGLPAAVDLTKAGLAQVVIPQASDPVCTPVTYVPGNTIASYENTGNDQTYSTYYSSTGGSMQVGGSADGTVDTLAMQLAAGQQLPNKTTQLATAGKQQTSNGKQQQQQQQQQQQKKKIEAGKKQSSAGQPGKPAAAKHEHLTALLLASMTDK